MQIPSVPTIPTDSLHRFLAITGLLLMFLPLLYLSNKIEEINISVIHVNAERELLGIQMRAVDRKSSSLYRRMFSLDVDSLSPTRRKVVIDSVFKSKKLAFISNDSASSELQKIERFTTENLVLLVKIKEKHDVISAHLTAIIFYLWYAVFYLLVGAVMATLGFGMWYKKEYPEGITISFKKAKPIQNPATSTDD